jgi:hypothetical protein
MPERLVDVFDDVGNVIHTFPVVVEDWMPIRTKTTLAKH